MGEIFSDQEAKFRSSLRRKFRLGSKMLFVNLKRNSDSVFSTYLEEVAPEQRFKGETTALYTLAKQHIQEAANSANKMYTYVLQTSNQNMIEWQDQGEESYLNGRLKYMMKKKMLMLLQQRLNLMYNK